MCAINAQEFQDNLSRDGLITNAEVDGKVSFADDCDKSNDHKDSKPSYRKTIKKVNFLNVSSWTA